MPMRRPSALELIPKASLIVLTHPHRGEPSRWSLAYSRSCASNCAKRVTFKRLFKGQTVKAR